MKFKFTKKVLLTQQRNTEKEKSFQGEGQRKAGCIYIQSSLAFGETEGSTIAESKGQGRIGMKASGEGMVEPSSGSSGCNPFISALCYNP